MTMHPSTTLLEQYCKGDLSQKKMVVLAAHISECPHCQDVVKKLEQKAAKDFTEYQTSEEIDFLQMQDDILKAVEVSRDAAPKTISKKCKSIRVAGREIELPGYLHDVAGHMKKWKKIPGKNLYLNKADIEGEGNLYLIYVENGDGVPEHTHIGNEYMYVVSGSFRDEQETYSTGDFSQFGHEDTHTPVTEDADGCLLLAYVDAPFVFKKGLAKYLNPIGRLFF